MCQDSAMFNHSQKHLAPKQREENAIVNLVTNIGFSLTLKSFLERSIPRTNGSTPDTSAAILGVTGE